MAENILYLLRADKQYTELEARALDAALILHADHGSNNSTFTNHVVSSSGTDTYSAITASLCSLKGPRHGGANIKVVQMIDDLKAHVSDWTSEAQIRSYLEDTLAKRAFDGSGLIYGIGHAVYSLSDPRAEVLRKFAIDISREKGLSDEMELRLIVERVAREMLAGPPTAAPPPRTSTSTAAFCIRCSACRRSCSRRCSPSRVCPAGAPTGWRSCLRAARSSARPASASSAAARMSRWETDNPLHPRRLCSRPGDFLGICAFFCECLLTNAAEVL